VIEYSLNASSKAFGSLECLEASLLLTSEKRNVSRCRASLMAKKADFSTGVRVYYVGRPSIIPNIAATHLYVFQY
jgi:hypothetical protein